MFWEYMSTFGINFYVDVHTPANVAVDGYTWLSDNIRELGDTIER